MLLVLSFLKIKQDVPRDQTDTTLQQSQENRYQD